MMEYIYRMHDVRGLSMLVAVCDDCSRDRHKVRELIETYGQENGIGIKVEEYSSGIELYHSLIDKMKRKNEKIAFSFVEGNIALEVQKIIYIETERHKNVFHTESGDYGLYKKLDEIETELAPFGFIRVHQSFLVNMRYVEGISSYVLKLNTGKELSVPKSRYQKVKKEYALYKEGK